MAYSCLKDKTSDSGMTLVEILIVVGIIAALATIALVFMGNTQIFKGRDARRKGDIKKIQVALEEYSNDNDCYPQASEVVCGGDGLSPYMDKIACDPQTQESYLYEPQTGACPAWYRIYGNLENKNDTIIEKLGCQTGCGPGGAYNYWAASPNAPNPKK